MVHNGISPCDLDFDQKAYDFAQSLQNLKDSGLQLVVFAGRLTYQKGVKYLLEAAKHVIKHNENALFIIAGTGDLETHLLYESGRHGISNKVLFTGNLAKKELQSLYQAADLFVMPSISEPFGLVALEAGSQNTPLIISKTSGASEVLNHALKVDFWDSHLMANYILAILEHSALGNTMNEHTTSEISQLTWQECGKKLNSIYMMAINSCRATA